MCDAPESVTLENEKKNFKDIPGKNWHGLAGQFFFRLGICLTYTQFAASGIGIVGSSGGCLESLEFFPQDREKF